MFAGATAPAAAGSCDPVKHPRCVAFGQPVLDGSQWLAGGGVTVYSNGPDAAIRGPDVGYGYQYQSYELVNRLYRAKGWITSEWFGPGDQMFANAPANLTKEANGAIGYVAPGDVVALEGPGNGQVAIVDTVSASAGGHLDVQMVNQNANQVYSSARFIPRTHTLELQNYNWDGYTIQGIIHRPTLPIAIAGGTWTDRYLGVIGTAFAFDPVSLGQPLTGLEIDGPDGWNTDDPFLVPEPFYEPTGIGADRTLFWRNIPPVSGAYSVTGNGGSAVGTSIISSGSSLAAPQITSMSSSGGSATIRWFGPPSAKSFIVRVNPDPYFGVISGEEVVAGGVRSHTLTGLPLIPGDTYDAVVFAFSDDIATPGPLASPFNMSSDAEEFTAGP